MRYLLTRYIETYLIMENMFILYELYDLKSFLEFDYLQKNNSKYHIDEDQFNDLLLIRRFIRERNL